MGPAILTEHGTEKIVPHITVPSSISFLIVGGGITGILLARKIISCGYSCILLERGPSVGGVWLSQANKTSRVNTSEAAYRVAERGTVINMDHTPP